MGSLEPAFSVIDRLHRSFRGTSRLASALVATALALVPFATGSQASPVFQPGETMGIAFGAPLPEGFYGFDLEDYGKSDGSTRALGVNIPVAIWSTPLKVYDTRLEILYAAPFIHQNGTASGDVNHMDMISQALGPIIAHDFGHGFNASVALLYRSPDSAYHDYSSADFRLGLSYLANGYNISATFGYSGTFGGHQGLGLLPVAGYAGASDGVGVDLTATKKFGRLEVGIVGFAHTDTDTRLDNVGFNLNETTFNKRAGSIGVGGLVGFNFGVVNVQSMVTREIAKRFAYNGLDAQHLNTGYGERETRGWIRASIPFYIAN